MKNVIVFISTVAVLIHGKPSVSDDAGIVGGEDAPESGIPYMVNLRKFEDSKNVRCSGCILNKRWILTLAGCTRGVHLGHVYTAGSNYLSKGGEKYRESMKVLQSEYGVALVKVNRDIEFNDRIQPIALPTKDVEPGEIHMLSGWGLGKSMGDPDHLKVLYNITSLSNEECKKILNHNILDEFVCAVAGKGKGACIADSASPLVNVKTNQAVAIFLHTTDGCRGTGSPDMYWRLFPLVNWIKSVIESDEKLN